MAGDFVDSFDRPDGPAGNGWTLSPDGHGGSIGIASGALTTSGSGGTVAVYRPIDLTSSITLSVDVTPTSGFGGLRYRYTTSFLFGGNGSIDSGYGIYIYRGDENYSNSAIILFYNGQVIQQVASVFQFTEKVHLQFTLFTDGSIVGTVSSGVDLFAFQFTGVTPTYSGSNFTIRQELGDPRSAAPVQGTVDNLAIDLGSDGFNLPLIFQHPFSTAGSPFTDAHDGDGWTLTNDFNEITRSQLPRHRGHDHFHLGEDWVPDRGPVIGTDVYAIADGKVVFAQVHAFFGNTVIIAHDVSHNGIGLTTVYSLYAHLDSIAVAAGDVSRGTHIGDVGRTGAAHKPHLHWEVFSGDWSAYLAGTLTGYAETASPAGWFDPTDFVAAFSATSVPSHLFWEKSIIPSADQFLF